MTLPFRPLIAILLLSTAAAHAGELSGNLALDYRYFPYQPADTRQHQHYSSLSFAPEYYHDWDDGQQRLVVAPFLRLDQHDSERNLADFHQLYWRQSGRQTELKIGFDTVFWGVTESQHLVDIINQTDLVADIDGEQKLGQPMLNLSWLPDWGTLDGYLLPYFRERSFAGIEGRPRTLLPVTDDPLYESGAERRHLDWALRYSHSIGDWDLGVAHFRGTAREPRLLPELDDGELVLRPVYDQIDQTSLDLQATKGGWLWKLEWIAQRRRGEYYSAATAGFEYTIGQAFGSDADLGLIVEYLFDDRGARAANPFQDDLFAGLRLAFNDVQSSDLLIGVIADAQDGSRFYSLEASRRLGQSWRASVKARVFGNIPAASPLYGFSRDDYLQVGIGYYF